MSTLKTRSVHIFMTFCSLTFVIKKWIGTKKHIRYTPQTEQGQRRNGQHNDQDNLEARKRYKFLKCNSQYVSVIKWTKSSSEQLSLIYFKIVQESLKSYVH